MIPVNHMKKTVFLFLSITLLLKVAAQEILIKQLEDQLAKHGQQDSFRVNRLNQLALLYDVPAGRRDSIAREAATLSQQINYPPGEAVALINLAMVKTQKGENKEVDSLSQQALAIA